MTNFNNDSVDSGSSVTVSVDVTKIVKYVCFSGIIIIGIIFGTKCCHKMLDGDLLKL